MRSSPYKSLMTRTTSLGLHDISYLPRQSSALDVVFENGISKTVSAKRFAPRSIVPRAYLKICSSVGIADHQRRTSVSTANSGVQPSGGIILQIPYFLPSGAIFRMYSIGSRNSSSDGLKVGASCNAYGRCLLLLSRTAKGYPRLSTVFMSSGGARRALNGM